MRPLYPHCTPMILPFFMANSIRETMFCRAKGKLPRRSVRPATLATEKKVPEESSRSWSGKLADLAAPIFDSLIHLWIYLSIVFWYWPYLHQLCIYVLIYLSISIYPLMHAFICLFRYMSVYLSIYLSIYRIFLFFHSCIHVSVYLSMYSFILKQERSVWVESLQPGEQQNSW